MKIKHGEALHEAKIITTDSANDIAILKISGEFVALPLKRTSRVSLGEEVFTIGFPAPDVQGTAAKLTKGSVSDDPRMFQISIPIQPGNSGDLCWITMVMLSASSLRSCRLV